MFFFFCFVIVRTEYTMISLIRSLSMTRSRDNGDDSESERSKRRHLENPDGEGEDTSQVSSPKSKK